MRFENPVRIENRIRTTPSSRLAAAFCAAAIFAIGTLSGGCGGSGGGSATLPAIAPAPEEKPPSANDGGAPAAPTSAAPAPSSNVKAAGNAKVGDTAHCPVSGEEFVVTSTSPHADYNGKTYYFCCGGCEKKFLSNPQKYTSETPKG